MNTNSLPKQKNPILFLLVFIMLISLAGFNCNAQTKGPVNFNKEGNLIYQTDSLGNRIPDFSYCGYKRGEVAIPHVQAKVKIPLIEGDATHTIQKAINYLASLPLNASGFRGAIFLEKGEYNLNGRLHINQSGIVLRGSGTGPDGTTLVADGFDRETLIRIAGNPNLEKHTEIKIIDNYVPVNALTFNLESTKELSPGDNILIRRPSTAEWIAELQMMEFGGKTDWIGWKPGTRDIVWDRKILKIEGNRIYIDAPLTSSLDSSLGRASVQKYSRPGRISHVGIENLSLKSVYDSSNLKDENHCWTAISFENTIDAWVRQITFEHFAGSAVAVFESSKNITVEDCISRNPVSEIAAHRRNTFFTSGQQTLFQRCYAEAGYHDFAVGFCAAGPNAFVECESFMAFNFSGTIDSWSTGVLFDNVRIDGHALSFKNRMQDAQGAGWTAANSVLWQCSASRIECFSSPTAKNWAIGTWGSFSGNAVWYETNDHVNPRSLYIHQLKTRIADPPNIEDSLLPIDYKSSTSPSIEQAEQFTSESKNPQIQLKEWIEKASSRNPIPTDSKGVLRIDEIEFSIPENSKTSLTVRIENGWLVTDSGIMTGKINGVRWWRGNARPFASEKANVHLTRYVPGRVGTGYTDNLENVTAYMLKNNIVGIEHNYGLWYDRRRDDHERVRRMDGDVWPPFYELPFARSGVGLAWDGLSKYDLTKYNPWYWNRLKEFANLADQEGLILLHQNYFQHNILEAGAHWADFPWRTANNINNTGFPEPPPYVGDKRIFMDEQFYDITNPVRRELHKAYIRQCLNNFADNQNVIQLISAEYTGPLHFVEFWLDVIEEWEQETGRDAMVALSATKDVQDAILNDPKRSATVDIIDIRYWHYREDGSLYNPPGGVHMAPRQHARQESPGKVSFESVYKAVKEYKLKYPEKAVTYSGRISADLHWSAFMAGASLSVLPATKNSELAKLAGTMKLLEPKSKKSQKWILSNDQDYVVFCERAESLNLGFIKQPGNYLFTWINPETGSAIKKETRKIESANTEIDIPLKENIAVLIIKE